MATIRNPYVTPAIRGANGGFLDPGIGALFQDIGMAANASAAGSRNDANEARASYDNARAQGQRDTNEAMRTAPATLAEIFANGGKLNDSQTQLAPDWQARLNEAQAPLDYSATPSRPDTKTISSVFATEGMSAKEQMGMAIQEALARGVNIGDIAKFFGQGGYLKAANSDNPEDGMKFMPLFGAAANQNTAITERQQNKLEGNDTNRAFGVANINAGSALAVAKQQGINQRDLATHKQPFDAKMEQYKQDGRLRLAEYQFDLKDGVVTSAKPNQVPIISSKLTDGMRTGIATRAKEAGIVFEGGSENSILAEVLKRYQDPKLIGNGYKNPTVALDSVIEDLQAGQFAKLQQGQEPPAGGWTSFSNLFRGKDNKVGGRTTFNFAPGGSTGTALSPTSPEAAPAIERPTRPAAPAFTMPIPAPAAPPAAATPAARTGQMRRDPGALDDARRSIANGASRDKVLQRLQELGIDSTGL
jgi:hypothetical protein